EASVEARLEVAERFGVTGGLTRDRLNAGDDVLDAMPHLAEKQVLFLARRAQDIRLAFRRLLSGALLPREIRERARQEEAEKPEIGEVSGRGFLPEFQLRTKAERPQPACHGEYLVDVLGGSVAAHVPGAEEDLAVRGRALEHLHGHCRRAKRPQRGAE